MESFLWIYGGEEFQQKEKEKPCMKEEKPFRISCNTWALHGTNCCHHFKQSCFQFYFILYWAWQLWLYVQRNLKQENCFMPRQLQLQPELGPYYSFCEVLALRLLQLINLHGFQVPTRTGEKPPAIPKSISWRRICSKWCQLTPLNSQTG